MKKVLLAICILSSVSTADAQSLGCFVEFSNPGFCSSQRVNIFTDFASNQATFGTTAAQMVEDAFGFWDICEGEKDVVLSNSATCTNELTELQEYSSGYITGCELRKSIDARTIARLKRRIRKMRRSRR